MLTVEKVLFLRKIDLFADLSPRDLGHIARVAQEVTYPAGSTIFNAGDYGDALFIIAGGEVTASRDHQILGVLREADYFGEMAVLTGETRSATINASTDCLLLRIGQSELHDILADNFNAVLSVIRTLCKRLPPPSGLA
jgi:CRP-like cAMP-binding protein